MNILIVSYFFIPERTPRAYRTYELVKEIARRGHSVTVIIPKMGCQCEHLIKGVSYYRINTGFFFNRNRKMLSDNRINRSKRKSKFKASFSRLLNPLFYFFYLGGDSFEYCISIFRALKGINKKFDLCISVGLPVSTHLGVWLGKKFKRLRSKVYVADYGDPFSYASKYKFHRIIEHQVLKSFNYISVPTELAFPAFTQLVDTSKLRVIPQGFDFSEVKVYDYKEGKIPVFCYAGVFYDGIRDPTSFFEYLSNLSIDFSFIIYTRLNHRFSIDLLNKYKRRLGDKLVVFEAIDRLDLIYELSKMDFLINFENASKTQSPSKLIDYELSRRPVHNVSCTEFNKESFFRFLNRENCESEIRVNLKEFDIVYICDKFLQLDQ